jgi:benzaldehyde dehydrogenase (NAD)
MPSTNSVQTEIPPSLNDEQLLYIDGSYVPADSGSKFTVQNPMTGKPLYSCASASISDYTSAIQSAHTAFESWSQTPPSQRRMIMLKAADIMESYFTGDAPAILSSEVSAVKSWIRVNIFATAGILRETAGLVTHIKGEIVPADRPGTTIMVLREAVGVVFAVSPWNAPVNLTARAIACPLVCGNTVVLKPSEFSPKSQHLVVRAFTEAGLPKGCLNFLPSSPEDAPAVTEYAVKHPFVRRVNFTGSDRVGKIIAGWAATCLKQCVLELGGKAPVVVLDDADVQDAAEGIVFGGYLNSGQICMSSERVIVQKELRDKLTGELLQRVRNIRCGNHMIEPDVAMSGLFTAQSARRVADVMRKAIDQGAKLFAGYLKVSGPNGTVIAPHVLGDVTPAMDVYHEESFGPVITITSARSEKEAIDLANTSEYSLCASVYSKDTLRAMRVAKMVRAGSCHINGPTVYIEATLPNGGTGG